MDIYEAINSRRTVRDFIDQEIEADIVKRIIAAGLKAPSNDHLRQWEFILLNDRAARANLIDQLNESYTEEEATELTNRRGLTDEFQREMYIDANQKQYSMLVNAGCLIIPCMCQKTPLLEPSKLSSLSGLAAMWCCIENILLAAASEGIYGVTRIPCLDGETKHIKNTLDIPENYEVPCYIALGYPDENAKKIRQHFIMAEERMHFNKW
ncbi:MAG: nitroreductase family protein [Clostridia bacterium]